MQLNDHTDFGLRILMTLGASPERRWSARQLAESHGLSFTHVQKVVQSLEGAGLVETFRGRNGGVSLARPTESITVGEVVAQLEPHMGLVRCLRSDDSGCVLHGGCALASVLNRARAAFQAELDAVTLDQVIQKSARVGSLRS